MLRSRSTGILGAFDVKPNCWQRLSIATTYPEELSWRFDAAKAKLLFAMPQFWWVNHNQTVRQEIDGQYLWSPKTESNGARSEFL
ncbi:MAG: hypothetical protein WDN69_29840 [Aliidongia sp.]